MKGVDDIMLTIIFRLYIIGVAIALLSITIPMIVDDDYQQLLEDIECDKIQDYVRLGSIVMLCSILWPIYLVLTIYLKIKRKEL